MPEDDLAARAAASASLPLTTATSTATPSIEGASPSSLRPRHQFTRSLSELPSPIRLHRHSKHRPGGSSRDGSPLMTVSTAPSHNNVAAAAMNIPRSSRPSLEIYRPDGTANLIAVSNRGSPSPSRHPSLHGTDEPRSIITQQQHPYHGQRKHSGGSSSNTNAYQHPAGIAALTAAAAAGAAGSPTSLKMSTVVPRSLSNVELDDPSGATAVTAASSFVSLPDTAPILTAAMCRLQRDRDRSATRLLQATLSDLDELSAATSRRLDTAYTSVLARVGVLQGTIQALWSLAVAAQATNRKFRDDTRALVNEVEQQVLHFEGKEPETEADPSKRPTTSAAPLPADQMRRLEQLHARVQAGRQAVQTLSGRVDTVRERVRCWELADLAWQERTRRRLKVLWVIVSGVLLALVVLLVVTARSSKEASPTVDSISSSSSTWSNLTAASLAAAAAAAAAASSRPKIHISLHDNRTTADGDTAAVGGGQDPLVQLFDEL